MIIVEISATAQQVIKSFGVSGAWWPNDLTYFPAAAQQNLSSLLFSKDGLYVSGYRYNVGATGNEWDNMTNVASPMRAVQSFMKNDGTYDWTRDAGGVYYLKAAQAAKVPSIAFFANALPTAMTENNKPCDITLISSFIPQHVAYLVKVIAYWAAKGINIEYVSPMNEPDSSFSKGSEKCGQEGMSVDKSIRPQVFQQLKAALAESADAKSVKIMGDETSLVASQALKEYGNAADNPGWLTQTLEDESIDAIAVHMYDFPDDATLKNYRQLVINASLATTKKKPPPPIKMTEISSFSSALEVRKPWGQTGNGAMSSEYDPSIDNALDMARMIWQWMTLVNAESWDWWTAVSCMLPCDPTIDPTCPSKYAAGKGWNDAFIYIDPNYRTNKNYDFYINKKFYVFKHFTTFVRPGAVRYDIPNKLLPYGTVAMASQGTDKTWNTIFINRNETAQAINFKMPGTGGKVVGMTQTTNDADWQSVTLPTVANDNTVKIKLPARGVLSMQFTVAGDPVAAGNVATADKRDIQLTGNEILEAEMATKPRGRFSRPRGGS